MRSVREAKEFLASQIAEEAQREGTPLCEIERKMLYFSEASACGLATEARSAEAISHSDGHRRRYRLWNSLGAKRAGDLTSKVPRAFARFSNRIG